MPCPHLKVNNTHELTQSKQEPNPVPEGPGSSSTRKARKAPSAQPSPSPPPWSERIPLKVLLQERTQMKENIHIKMAVIRPEIKQKNELLSNIFNILAGSDPNKLLRDSILRVSEPGYSLTLWIYRRFFCPVLYRQSQVWLQGISLHLAVPADPVQKV